MNIAHIPADVPRRLLWFLITVALGTACSSSRAGTPSARHELAAARATEAPRPSPTCPVVVSAPEETIVEMVHGARVADPFRWLEDRDSPRTQAWSEAEEHLTHTKLQASPLRPSLVAELQRGRAQRVWNKMPLLRSGKYIYQHQDEGNERGGIYEYDPVARREILILDLDKTDPPVKFWRISSDGSLLTALVSKNGGDALTGRVFDLRARAWLSDTVPGFRYSFPEWAPHSKGFYYTWSPTDESLTAEKRTARSEIRFHSIGSDAAKDKLVRAATAEDGVFEFPYISDDGRWLAVERIRGTPETSVFLLDRHGAQRNDWKRVTPPDSHAKYTMSFIKDGLILSTDEGAPRRRAFLVDLQHPARAEWKDVAAERRGATLVDVGAIGDYVAYQYLRDAETTYEIRRRDGSLVKTLTPPSPGTLVSLASESTHDDATIAFATYTDPYRIYSLHPPSFDLIPFPSAVQVTEKEDRYVTEKVFYTSPDGTRAPIFVVRARSTPAHKPAPLILYGYGAFGENTFPRYKRGLGVWLDRGGVYAETIIRGGGEYGQAWHDAGRGINRKNVYDDFIASAEYLVHEQWTAPDRLVVRGASAGGTLVAIVEAERPDLFRGAIAEVPLSDLVRYTVTKGNGPLWIGEYGSPDIPEEFAQLLRYSPYHRVKRGVRYPWTFVVGSDDDDRVDPMHGRKLVAALQAANPCGTTLLRMERNAAHGGPATASAWIQEEADIYTFAFAAVGYTGP